MRKLLLMSALLFASASAQAGPSAGPLLAAADDMPAATATDTPQPLPPASQTDAPKPAASEPAKPVITSRPHARARRFESDEARARRIAARYGISW
jgi:hypothetical protein